MEGVNSDYRKVINSGYTQLIGLNTAYLCALTPPKDYSEREVVAVKTYGFREV
jgi:hypothetical protein